MKKVVVIEDESLVRLGICTMLAQRGEEYCVVGESEDGNKAVDIIIQKKPEIVLLDITIPGKNGMEVLQEIRQMGFEGYVMMLTCHENFEMARQAIRFGANDYVLKSELDAKDLFDYLDKIEIPAKKKDNHHGKTAELVEKRQAFLTHLFLTGSIDEDGFDSACKEYGISLTRQGLHFFLLHIPNYSRFIMRYERQEQEVLLGAMTVIASESLGNSIPHLVFCLGAETYIILFSIGEERGLQARSTLAKSASALHRNFNIFLDTNVVIGVSSNVEQIKMISPTYTKLTRLLERNFFFPQELTVWDTSTQEVGVFAPSLEKLKSKLNELIKASSQTVTIQEIFLEFQESCRPPWVVPDKGAFVYLIQDFLQQLSSSFGITCPDISMDENYEIIINKIIPVIEGSLLALNPQNHITSLALIYIEEHYMEEISLESIADKIGVSSSYLSRVFSRYVKQSISVYIMSKRISHAKQLLATTNIKNYEIAEACGLNSAAYFTSVFKKSTGMTPNQYRNTHRTKK